MNCLTTTCTRPRFARGYACAMRQQRLRFANESSAEAMDLHLQGADERSKAAYRFIEPASIEIYGTPNNYALEMMKKIAGSGIDVSVNPQFIGGFIRPKSG